MNNPLLWGGILMVFILFAMYITTQESDHYFFEHKDAPYDGVPHCYDCYYDESIENSSLITEDGFIDYIEKETNPRSRKYTMKCSNCQNIGVIKNTIIGFSSVGIEWVKNE